MLLYKHILTIGNFNWYNIIWDNCILNFIAQVKIFANWIVNKNTIYKLEIIIAINV